MIQCSNNPFLYLIVKLLNIIVKYLIDCQIYDKFYFLIFSKTNNQAIIKFDA